MKNFDLSREETRSLMPDAPPDQEQVVCNLCGSTQFRTLYTLQDWAYETAGRFTFVQCECGLVYLNPRPTAEKIGDYYPTDYIPYYASRPPAGKLSQFIYFWKWRARCLQVLKVCRAGRILDVGCSSGLFLQALKRYGPWETHGVEIDATMAGLAEQGGVQVVQGDLRAAHYPSNHFDVVTLWDVLEHVHDPKADLAEIFRILKPGGSLFVSAPNLNSLDAQIFKQYWIGFDAPRHLYVYNAGLLRRFLDQTGFEVDKVFSFYGRYTAFALSLQNRLKQFIKSSAGRKWLSKMLFFPLWRQVTLPFFWLLDRSGRGVVITVRARRRLDT